MANHFKRASFSFKLSGKAKSLALQVLACAKDSALDFTQPHEPEHARVYGSNAYEIAKKLMLSSEDYTGEDNDLEFSYEPTPDGIAISYHLTMNPEKAAMFVHLILERFSSDEYVCFESSNVCSEPQANAFGGEAYFITKKGIKSFSTDEWLIHNINSYLNNE
jgi:hypothetical protein